MEASPRRKDQCIEWTGAISPEGYGKLSRAYAHRIAYETEVGPIPDGYQIDHLCRNRKCVNVNHLEAVTQKENILRGESVSAKHARKTHCIRGHKFDRVRKTASGTGRVCSICVQIRNARHASKKA